jgi:hypothetical protein
MLESADIVGVMPGGSVPETIAHVPPVYGSFETLILAQCERVDCDVYCVRT